MKGALSLAHALFPPPVPGRPRAAVCLARSSPSSSVTPGRRLGGGRRLPRTFFPSRSGSRLHPASSHFRHFQHQPAAPLRPGATSIGGPFLEGRVPAAWATRLTSTLQGPLLQLSTAPGAPAATSTHLRDHGFFLHSPRTHITNSL